MPSDPPRVQEAVEAILGLLERRGQDKTICPSEAARVIASDGDFRSQMAVVRDAARELVARGAVEVLQHGGVVDLDKARGPVRLGIADHNRPPSRG